MATLKLEMQSGQGWLGTQTALKKTSELIKGTLSDNERLQKTVYGLDSAFRSMGMGALGALGGIALVAPSLAGDMARIAAASYQITDSIGKAAKPAFDALAGTMEGISSFLKQNPWAADLTAGLLTAAAAVKVGGVLWSGLSGVVGLIEKIVGFSLTPIILPIALSLAIPNALNMLLPELNSNTKAGIDKAAADTGLGNIPGFTGGAEGLAKLGNAFNIGGVPIGKAVTDYTMIGGLAMTLNNVGRSAGIFPGGAPSGDDWIKSTLSTVVPFGPAGANLVIQILDQNGQRRDMLVVNGQASGGTR